MKRIIALPVMTLILALILGMADQAKAQSFQAPVTLDLSSVAVGSPITASWSPTGGIAPYKSTAHWWYRLPSGNLIILDPQPVTGTSSQFIPVAGVSGGVNIHIEDATGAEFWLNSNEFCITGDPIPSDPMQCTITLDKDEVSTWSPITASWQVSDGRPPYGEYYYIEWFVQPYSTGDVIPTNGPATSSYVPVEPGVGRFRVKVEDSLGNIEYFTKNFNIIASANEPIYSLSLSEDSIKSGEPITASYSVSWSEPHTLEGRWWIYSSGLHSHDVVLNSGSGSTSLQPACGDRGYFELLIRHTGLNRARKIQSGDFVIEGEAAPLSITGTLDHESIVLGDSISANWQVTGGGRPIYYDYTWAVMDENENWIDVVSKEKSTQTDASFTPDEGVKGRLKVKTYSCDTWGAAYDELLLEFDIEPEPNVTDDLSLAITMDKTIVDVSEGETIMATFQPKGGRKPYSYLISWYIWDDDLSDWTEVEMDYTDTGNTSSFRPQYGRLGSVWVQVQDADDSVASVSEQFSIINSAQLDPMALEASFLNTEVDFYEPKVEITFEISGGQPPYQLESILDYENEYVTSGNAEEIIDLYLLDKPGEAVLRVEKNFTSATIKLTALDAAGRRSNTISRELSLLDPNPMSVSAQADKPSVIPGERLRISWEITGGVSPYSVTISNLYVSTETDLTAVDDDIYPKGNPADIFVPDKMDTEYDIFYWVIATDQEGRERGTRLVLSGNTDTSPKLGDATNDGAVDILDLVSIIDYIVSNTSPASPTNADANGDGTVDILDLVWIIDWIVGG